MSQLTVLIPCKNEQDNIVACLLSVKDLADEILIADSGSTDRTLELVDRFHERFGKCRVIRREFINSGDFKNWAIPQAHHEWVVVVDADERIEPELANEIRTTLTSGPRKDGYWIHRKNHFMGHAVQHTSWGRDTVIRLFHRDRARYQINTDHSEIDLPSSRVGRLRASMTHFTCWDYDTYLPKMMRYTKQQAELWHAQGKKPRFWKLVTTGPFRFLRSYVVELGLLDGWAGFQISMLTGFYSFLKQARLWQLTYRRQPPQAPAPHEFEQMCDTAGCNAPSSPTQRHAA